MGPRKAPGRRQELGAEVPARRPRSSSSQCRSSLAGAQPSWMVARDRLATRQVGQQPAWRDARAIVAPRDGRSRVPRGLPA